MELRMVRAAQRFLIIRRVVQRVAVTVMHVSRLPAVADRLRATVAFNPNLPSATSCRGSAVPFTAVCWLAEVGRTRPRTDLGVPTIDF